MSPALPPPIALSPDTSADRSAQVPDFEQRLDQPLTKRPIRVLQINLGRRCNLACQHCHVEAGPQRQEELSPELCQDLIEVIDRFDQIETIDLTGGAPEMNYGFRQLVEAGRARGKEVIVRSNLTIFFVPGYEDLPNYFAQHRLRVIASLPCYLAENVDRQRGQGVFGQSIEALRRLNRLGYGRQTDLKLDLVYNPPVPTTLDFRLPPAQPSLEQAYKQELGDRFGLVFNQLLTITNLPIGRTQQLLDRRQLHQAYLDFLARNFNPATIDSLMCRNQVSIDYLGRIYDCDFNQMAGIPALLDQGETLMVRDLLRANSLDLLTKIETAPYCYGCTAGSGSSCGGALV